MLLIFYPQGETFADYSTSQSGMVKLAKCAKSFANLAKICSCSDSPMQDKYFLKMTILIAISHNSH
ncbi:hypothetical protein FFT88_16890 [Escherichia sp. E4930]|nr:hypothetical protein FFT88_16890 [Escherichia sp. E4930]